MSKLAIRPGKKWAAACISVGLLGLATVVAVAEPSQSVTEKPPLAEVSAPVTPFVWDGDVRMLPKPVEWKPGDPVREIPRRFYPKAGFVDFDPVGGRDPLVDIQDAANRMAEESAETSRAALGGGTFGTPSRNFAGFAATGSGVPDTVGDVGTNHFIQMVNAGGGARVRIWDKAEPTPNQLADFFLDGLASGQCASGFGDPVVIYDREADRWLLSEFSSSGNNNCVYISQTSDPVSGGWFAYAFSGPSFPDYPHYAVWPTDANQGLGSYLITVNDGPSAWALDRGNMLAGNAATFQRLTLPNLPGFGFEAATAADIDGPNQPAPGAPGIVMRHRDTEVHSGPAAPGDLLEMFEFNIDWTNSSNTTLTQIASIDVAEFDSSLCGLSSFNCFPQPGTGTTLDPLREVIMHRLQYIHHDAGFETLVGNFVVDIDGANTGGIRWFELRRNNPTDPWGLEQEGTWSIDDGDSRWMGASSMDQSGNIALAYNISSTNTFPSLRYTGHAFDGPAGVMTEGENDIHVGTASSGTNRYGDYAAMGLDPSDDCTFWFTGEDNTSSVFRTQIASFRFEACGCDLRPSPLVASAQNNGDNQIDVTFNDADLASIVEYRVRRSRTMGGPYSTIATVVDSSPGVANSNGYLFSDNDVSGGLTYYYIVQAFDGEACISTPSDEINESATGTCLLAPIFGGLDSAVGNPFGICSVDLSWTVATAECSGPISYNLYRSPLVNFVPGPPNLLVEGLTGTTFKDLNSLVDGVFYNYVLRAVDDTNGKEETNVIKRQVMPQGVGGEACLTGSACAENPFVDVVPDGPQTVCSESIPLLTANLTDGVGPFDFQWTQDGLDIPGATSQSFLPTDIGLHTYNLKVRATACPDTVFDGLDTEFLVVNQPFFNGIQTVVNPQNDTCTLNLDWDPATSVCAGPVRYFVYRDTDSNVEITPQNLIAGGILADSYTDITGLADSVRYYYTVQAADDETDVPDGNTIARSDIPDGPFNGIQPFFFENFTSGSSLNGWTINLGPGPNNCGNWSLSSSSAQRPSSGSGQYMTIDSECQQLLPLASASIETPAIDVSIVSGLIGVTLEYDIDYNHNGGEDATVEVWDGSQWVVLWADTNTDLDAHHVFDVASYAVGNPDFKIRFNYQGGNADRWLSIDDVEIKTEAVVVCSTGLGGPFAVATGSGLTDPLRGARVDVAGNSIEVSWDTGCGATDFNLLYGDLNNVSTVALSGSQCGLGNGGTFSWNGVPAGSLFFLVVATDGVDLESSWGTDSNLGERNALASSGECGAFFKDVANSCE